MNSSQEEAKIAFGDLLSSTVASKSGTFAVGRQANRVIPNFPANPGLRVRGIAGIDPNENISLPLSDEMGEIFFRDKEAPRFTKEGEQDAVGPASDDIDITHPIWNEALILLAKHAVTELGAVDPPKAPLIALVEKMLLILPPNSKRLNSHLYHLEGIKYSNEKHFGTLLIQLPSVFSEELAVECGDAQLTFSMGGNSDDASKCHAQYETHYACHFKEGCETRTILDWGDQQGGRYRAVLVYHLEWDGSPETIPRPIPPLDQGKLNVAMKNMDIADRMFVVPLILSYTVQELDQKGGISALNDRDTNIVTAIESAGSDCNASMNFRLGAFEGYVNISNSNRQRKQVPDSIIWFDESGFRADDDAMLDEIDWSVYTAGGHVMAEKILWIDEMVQKNFDIDSDDGKCYVVLFAYADIQKEQKGNKRQKKS